MCVRILFYTSLSLSVGNALRGNDVQQQGGRVVLDNVGWTPVPLGEYSNVLALLKAVPKSNYDKMRTWSGTYKYELQQGLAAPQVGSLFKGRTQNGYVGPLTQRISARLQFKIDLKSAEIFRELDVLGMKFSDSSAGNDVAIRNVGLTHTRSIVSPTKYVYFPWKNVIPDYSVLPGDPRLKKTRAAYVAPVSEAVAPFGDMMDPRDFFSTDGGLRCWETADLLSRGLDGELGAEMQDELRKRVKIRTAVGVDGLMYEVGQMLTMPDGSSRWSTTVWCENLGFHPILHEDRSDRADGYLEARKEWRWERNGEVYLPVWCREGRFGERDNKRNYVRESVLQNSDVNGRIDQQQFELEGLGIKNGDVILNNIEKSVYQWVDGKLIKRGNYGDKYVNPEQSKTRFNKRVLLILGNVAFALVGMFVIALRRKVRRSARAGGE